MSVFTADGYGRCVECGKPTVLELESISNNAHWRCVGCGHKEQATQTEHERICSARAESVYQISDRDARNSWAQAHQEQQRSEMRRGRA